MALKAFISFCFKNYLRQHRYLRDLIAIVIFSIFFGGFLTGGPLHDNIWLIFTIFAVILNLLTAPSLFFLEQGNTLYFLLSKPNGRKYLFLSKIIVIVLIDLFWVFCFAALYGLRFLSPDYFLLLPLRLTFIAVLLLLSTLLFSLSYTYPPQLSWLIFVLLIFGSIIHKAGYFPIKSAAEMFKVLVFLLPPFFEIHALTISLDFSGYSAFFLAAAIVQIAILYFVSGRKMLWKDFL
jgi:hypothetical protein